MSDPTPRSRSLLEFSVVLVVIGVAAAYFVDGLYYVQEQAERTVMEATVRNMDSGARMEAAMRSIRGQESSIGELIGSNPVQWLENPPVGYSGLCEQQLVAGGWCFDAANGDGQELKCHAQVLAAMLADRFLGQPSLFSDQDFEAVFLQ